MVENMITDIDENANILPQKPFLYQNFPNPFNPSTMIEFDLPQKSDVNLKIYNILGQEILTLIDKETDAGKHQIQWNAKNQSSGIYFLTLKINSSTNLQRSYFIKKMILLK